MIQKELTNNLYIKTKLIEAYQFRLHSTILA